jgi:hypothetical protein
MGLLGLGRPASSKHHLMESTEAIEQRAESPFVGRRPDGSIIRIAGHAARKSPY